MIENNIVQYGHKTANVRPAGGTRGTLHRSFDGEYFLRIHTSDTVFTDYAIKHDDLEVTISEEALASFYQIGDDHFIDHNPSVLGLQVID